MIPEVFEQAQALTTLDGRPLVVLTASETLDTSGWAAAQDKLAALSTNHVPPRRRLDPRGPGRGRARLRRVGAGHHRGRLRGPHRHAPGHAVSTTRPVHPPTHHTRPEESRCPTRPPTPPRTPRTRRPRSRGPCSPWPWPPRSWSSSTSPSSTPPSPPSGATSTSSGGQLQWLVTAYLMMSGGGLLLGGRIADLLSRRGVFLTGLTLFTIASLVSGFADNGSQLIAARAVQGLSAALLTPSALSLIMTTYAGAQRKTALAMWGAVGSLGVAAGVLLGGAVTTWASWQFIFWINGPIGLVALIVGHRIIAKQPVTRPSLTDFDIPGAVIVIAGLGDPDLRPGRHRHPRLVVRADRGSPGRLGPPGGGLPDGRAARGQAAVPPARVEAQGPRVRHRRHARRHRHPGRRRLPGLDLPADRARLLRPGHRARLPAVRARHHRRHRGRPAPARPRVTARHRHAPDS